MTIDKTKLEIEIVDVEDFGEGVNVFARAWHDGKQIGFGKDGTVDVERFRIINPPILVPDENGDITREWEEETDEIGEDGRFVKVTKTKSFREDPEEALLQSLSHTISIVAKDGGNIKAGKVGNTTSTYYPNAGDTSPIDMELSGGGYTATSFNSWDDAHDDTVGNPGGYSTASGNRSATVLQARLRSWINSGGWIAIYRNSIGFPTTDLGTDNIDSATISLYLTEVVNNFSQSVVLDKHTPTTEGTTPLTDYATTNFDSVEQCTSVSVSTLSTGAYEDFTLNSTGEGNINKDSNSYFALRMTGDMTDTEPSWSSNKSGTVKFSSADETGTTQDPKLVVEHSAGGGGSTFKPRVIMF